jgi:hypothetical protein
LRTPHSVFHSGELAFPVAIVYRGSSPPFVVVLLKEDSTINTNEIQSIIRGYFRNLHSIN